MTAKRLVGITGGIGAGKSVVSRILRTFGYGVYDCDDRARNLMENEGTLKEMLRRHFGFDVIGEIIDRRALADIIFNNEEDRLWLNGCVHSAVREDLERWMGEDAGNLFVECAILYESHLCEMCAQIWYVEAPADVRLQRAMARSLDNSVDNATSPENRKGKIRDDILRRIESQKNEYEGLCSLSRPIVFIRNYNPYSLLDQLNF